MIKQEVAKYIYTFSPFFCCIRIWTQDLYLDSLHQAFFCEGFFLDKVS
jgi:hypothetical protein